VRAREDCGLRRILGGVPLKFKKKETVRLRGDAPGGGPRIGDMGVVVRITPGYPPLRGSMGKPTFYDIDLLNEHSQTSSRHTVEENLLEAAETTHAPVPLSQETENSTVSQPETPPVAANTDDESRPGSAHVRFRRDDRVRLQKPLEDHGLPAGSVGKVTFINPGPPVVHLVEIEDGSGASPILAKIDEKRLTEAR